MTARRASPFDRLREMIAGGTDLEKWVAEKWDRKSKISQAIFSADL